MENKWKLLANFRMYPSNTITNARCKETWILIYHQPYTRYTNHRELDNSQLRDYSAHIAEA